MQLPPFHPDGGAALIAAHGLVVAGLVAAMGGLVLLEWIVRPEAACALTLAPGQDLERMPRRFGTAGLWLALIAMVAWYWLQTADFLGERDVAQVSATLWPVLRDTSFGHVWILQAGAIVAALLAGWRGLGRIAAILASLALASETAYAHLPSMAIGDAGYVFALFVGAAHLLGGGFWVGGLWPLRWLLRHAPKPLALAYARGFSIWGKVAVGTVAASGTWQSSVLVGDLPRLFGTAYGWMVLSKILLFLVLLGFALFNRYTMAPRLANGDEAAARRTLARAILMQSLAGIAVIVAAMILSALPPAMHVRPIDPFASRPGPVTISQAAISATHAADWRISAWRALNRQTLDWQTLDRQAQDWQALGWPTLAAPGKLPRRPARMPIRGSGGAHAHSTT